MIIVAVIPARYASTRFPGKPLADINGKPMIWWVYNEALKNKYYDSVIVATESQIVVDRCKELGINVALTSDNHHSGTDRVVEVADKIEADLYVVLMGDEPLLSYIDQMKLVEEFKKREDTDAIMLCEKFINPVDAINSTTIKLAINRNNELIYMSRSPIPYPKDMLNYNIYKNVGCYAFTRKALDFYKMTEPGILENIEGIELLRLLENHKLVLTVEISSESMSVDTQKDLERVRKILRNA